MGERQTQDGLQPQVRTRMMCVVESINKMIVNNVNEREM